MTNQLPVSELDFFALKEQLKTFLKTQDRFKDYNFEGSNLSVLLDILAYNTYQNNFYNNMIVSEMFLDSALRENSAVSHAKSLNYLPQSRRSSKAIISFNISAPKNLNFVTIPEKTRFIAAGEQNTSYSFYTDRSYTINKDENGLFKAECIEILEGEYITEQYTILSDDNARYKITNGNVDISSIKVTVTDTTSNISETYLYTSSIFGIDTGDRVFYLQKSFGNYEIYFGKDIFGKQPPTNSIVRIEYRVTKGSEANDIIRFSLSGAISGYQISPITISGPSAGGADSESIDSIKFFAPKSIQVQERAVTEKDYEILLKKQFPEINAVSVIGGEKLNPPKYGRVAIYVDAGTGSSLSINLRDKIEKYLNQKTPLGITPLLQTPNYTYVEVVSVVNYDDAKTLVLPGNLKSLVQSSILDYSKNNLENFGRTLRYSKLTSQIDAANPNIVSNQTRIRAIVEKNVSVSSLNTFTVDFGNELVPIADYALRSLQSQVPTHPRIPKLEAEREDRYPTVVSSNFRLNGTTVYVRDDGFGVMQIIRSTAERDIIVNRNVGTIDYKTGTVSIKNLKIDSYQGTFKFYADTKSFDIFTPKSNIIKIRPEDIKLEIRSINA